MPRSIKNTTLYSQREIRALELELAHEVFHTNHSGYELASEPTGLSEGDNQSLNNLTAND